MMIRIVSLFALIPLLWTSACYIAQDDPTPERMGIEEYQELNQQRVQGLERDLEELYRDTVDMSEARRAEFLETLAEAEQEHQRLVMTLREDVPETEENLPDFHAEIENRLHDLEQQIEELHLQASESAGTFRELAIERLERLETMIQDQQTRIEGLEDDQRAQYESELTPLQQRRENLRGALDEQIADDETFEQARIRFSAEIAALRRDIRSVERSIDEELYEDGLPPTTPNQQPGS